VASVHHGLEDRERRRVHLHTVALHRSSAAHWLSLEVDVEGEEDVPMSGEPSPESGRRRGSDTMTLKGSVEWSSVVARWKEKGGMWGK
jgi:hypothetical protein